MYILDILLLIVLILLNGLFALTEMAVIASRDGRLQTLAREGRRGARSALSLKNNPAAFLSTIQVGITMVGILSGAVGEKALTEPLAQWLAAIPLFEPHARAMAMTLVVLGLTYFSVVVGELVPKHLGLIDSETIACLMAPLMRMLARAAKPVVWFFTTSSHLLLRLIGADKREDAAVTDEEIRLLMEQGAEAGVFHQSEQLLVANVLRLDEQPVVAIMTHRQEIEVLDLNRPEAEVRAFLARCTFSRVVVCRGGLEEILGLLRTADLLQAALACEPLAIEHHLRQPLYVPEYVTTTRLLELFRTAQLRCALVVDEYGDIQGFVTLTDVLTAIVGNVPSAKQDENEDIVQREDGSWLIDGGVAIDRVKSLLAVDRDFAGEQEGAYHTLAGFIIYALGRIPKETDHFDEQGYRFEVVDMDRNRVDKILVTPRASLQTNAHPQG